MKHVSLVLILGCILSGCGAFGATSVPAPSPIQRPDVTDEIRDACPWKTDAQNKVSLQIWTDIRNVGVSRQEAFTMLVFGCGPRLPGIDGCVPCLLTVLDAVYGQ